MGTLSGHQDPVDVASSAQLSADELYQWSLVRAWGDGQRLCWVMLNPSTADASEDDPTIRRCIGFATAWGFDSLVVVNLFGLRATDPAALARADMPIGNPDNDQAIRIAVAQSAQVIAAWGTKGAYRNRAAIVVQLITGELGADLYALEVTNGGYPKHPLYVKGNTAPILYRPAQRRHA